MFKFLKSKKGFTLVELMIVVVIMAILVAVAVPIYSAVTKNARKRTCIANLREIISQTSNYCMSNNYTPAATVTFTITSNGDKGTANGGETGDGAKLSNAVFVGLFQELPYCPASGTYTVTVAKATALGSEENGSVTVTAKCAGNTDDGTGTNTHVYGAAS